MNDKLKGFLDDICIHINCKAVHSDIREELTQHINDLKDDYIKQGYDEEKALDSAVLAMGDCDEIGIKLNKQHKPQTEWSLLALTFIIAAFGGAIMYISSNLGAYTFNFERYLVYAVFGSVILIGIYFFDYTKLKKLAIPIYIGVILLLISGKLFGMNVNGMDWLVIGRLSVSVSTLSPLVLIAIAGFMGKYRGSGSLGIIKLIALMMLPLVLIMMYPSLSMMYVISMSFIVMLTIAIIKNHFKGNKYQHLSTLYGIGITSVAFMIFSLKPYQLERLKTFFLRGKLDPQGSGFVQVMADKWLSVSEIFGATKATVESYSINEILPGATTDFVLVNIIATLGWAVGIALVIAVVAFIIRLIFTTRKVKDNFGFYVSLSACTVLTVKFILSIFINFNLSPLMSMSMPLISYGGTDYIVNMFLIGLVLSVWRRNNLVSYKTDTNAVTTSSKSIINFTDGKLVIDFKAWK